MRNLPNSIFGRSCPCGARVEHGNKKCRKCSYRSRWLRRKAHHDDAL